MDFFKKGLFKMNIKLKKFVIYSILVIIMIGISKIATNYYVVHTHIEPLSKNASLLTLLFMFFILLGSIMTSVVQLVIGNKK
jgi:hypothetical protein